MGAVLIVHSRYSYLYFYPFCVMKFCSSVGARVLAVVGIGTGTGWELPTGRSEEDLGWCAKSEVVSNGMNDMVRANFLFVLLQILSYNLIYVCPETENRAQGYDIAKSRSCFLINPIQCLLTSHRFYLLYNMA